MDSLRFGEYRDREGYEYGNLTRKINGANANGDIFRASLIIFQNIIPISLYVSIEFVKTMQAFFIHNDLDMFDEESNAYCIPRSVSSSL